MHDYCLCWGGGGEMFSPIIVCQCLYKTKISIVNVTVAILPDIKKLHKLSPFTAFSSQG